MSQEGATSSGRFTSDQVVSARPCRLVSVILEADATNAATITLYDNASAASGTVLAKVLVPATGVYEAFTSDFGIFAVNGIYADIGGTGAAAIVHYVPQ